VLDARDHNLPIAPRIELGLYRRPGLRADRVTDVLENLLWKSLA
jgi:hypothetical protein